MNEIKYQVKMTYEREDIGALVRTMEFRRHPEKNIRLARKIGYPIFGIAIMAAGVSLPKNAVRAVSSGVTEVTRTSAAVIARGASF